MAAVVRFWPPTGRYLRALVVIAIAAETSTFLGNVFFAWLFTPDLWTKLFYPRWSIVPAFTGLWGVVLLPAETRALASELMNRPALAPVAHVGVLAASAILGRSKEIKGDIRR